MTLRDIERDSIRAFVQSAADDGYLSRRVLDYGCGKQPYRDIVEAAGGHYIGYDDPRHPGAVVTKYVGDWSETDPLDAILCTQVVQYVPVYPYYSGLEHLLSEFFGLLEKYDGESNGHLVLTWPICWPLVEKEDLHRFTVSGMERLLSEAGFEILCCEVRAEYNEFPIGGQAIAKA